MVNAVTHKTYNVEIIQVPNASEVLKVLKTVWFCVLMRFGVNNFPLIQKQVVFIHVGWKVIV